MNYSEVLKRAWQIIWKFKVLWIFGILASCSQGSSNGGHINFTVGSEDNFVSPVMQYRMEEIGRYFAENLWIIGLMVMAICVLVLVALVIGIIGKVALIKGAQKADSGVERLGFVELLQETLPYFGRVFLYDILVGLVMFGGIVLFMLVAMFLSIFTLGLALICLMPLFCLMVPFLWAVGVVIEQGTIAIVVDEVGVLEGLSRGWKVVRNNPVPVLVMALILFVGALMVGLILAIPFMFTFIPFMFALMASGPNREGVNAAMVTSAACCAIYLPFLIVLNGVIIAYVQSAWTLTYLRLTRGGGQLPEEIPAPFDDEPVKSLDPLDA
jgi:hypothetical protein